MREQVLGIAREDLMRKDLVSTSYRHVAPVVPRFALALTRHAAERSKDAAAGSGVDKLVSKTVARLPMMPTAPPKPHRLRRARARMRGCDSVELVSSLR